MSFVDYTKTKDAMPVCFNKKTTYGIVDREGGEQVIETSEDDPFRYAIDKKKERFIVYITAPSGSGKSYFTRQIIEDYHTLYPKRPVYIFSSLDDDPTLDKLKYLKRIKIKSPAFLERELSVNDFNECLTIFDDCDCLTNKPIKRKVYELLNAILETGRHTKTSVVFTSHTATNGLETKKILNEAHTIVVFPRTAGNRTLKYLLYDYLGFNKEDLKKLKNCEGRWVAITKSFPMTYYSHTKLQIRGVND
jgi:hypothetical protein